MTTESLLAYLKEEHKVFHKLDRIMVFGYLLSFIVAIWLFDHYIVHLNITKQFLLIGVEVFIFGIIITQARALKRDMKAIETLIRKEVEPFLFDSNRSFSSWDKYKKHYPYIETILLIILFLIPIIKILFPANYFLKYFKETYLAIFIFYVSAVGFTTLITFKNYINGLINIYQLILHSKTDEPYQPEFAEYTFWRSALIATLASSLFFVICNYLILADITALHGVLFILSFWVLVMLGKGLFDAHKWFYKSLVQMDILRKKIGI
jgi:hypothetical protein